MKKLIFALTLVISTLGFAQNTLPSIEVATTDGKTVNTATLSNDGKPMVICFWATWCKPCMRELNAYMEVYEDWQDEFGVKIIAVSIDDARTSTRVGNVVTTKGWEYDVYLDVNQDFKRALGVNMPPHTFIIDGEGNIVWTHTGYALGDEDEVYEVLQNLAAGKPIKH